MKRKTREEKAITLIALIITIVVLLILAVVAINAVTGDGIIQHATNAKTEYEKAQAEEEDTLAYYQQYLDNKGDVGPWRQEGDKIVTENEDGTKIELQIGDKVNYVEPAKDSKTYSISYIQNGGTSEEDSQVLKTEELEWRVLGMTSNGKVELISTNPTTTAILLKGENGYLNATTILNNASNALYSTDKGIGRSININDLDKLAGISSDTTKRELGGSFGNKREYRYDANDNIVEYRESADGGTTWTEWGDSSYNSFKQPGKTEINSTNSTIDASITEINYFYTISEKINKTTRDNKSLADIITIGENEGNTYLSQLVASNSIYFSTQDSQKGLVKFSIRVLVSGIVGHRPLLNSNGDTGISSNCTLRPVVTLNSNVELYYNNGVWEIK